MHDILKSAAGGRGQSVLIEGTAGTGRTGLLRSAMDAAAEHGLHLLTARARASEQGLDLGIAQQLMAGARSILTTEAAKVTEAAETAATSVTPVVPGATGTAPAAGPSAGADRCPGPGGGGRRSGHLNCPSPHDPDPRASSDALHPLARLLATGTPLLLAVDDLQWADTASLRCLGYLMARLESMPVAIVATVALGETSGEPVLAEVLSSFRHRTLLGGLSDGAAAELAAQSFGRSPDASFLAACQEATGGNPYLLTSLFRAMRLRGLRPERPAAARIAELAPVEVADTLLPRYEHAYPGAATVLQSVAVLDGAATADMIARLPGLDGLRAADLVESLVRAGALTHSGDAGITAVTGIAGITGMAGITGTTGTGTTGAGAGPDADRPGIVRFAQPLLRAAVLARIPPSRRDAMHARAAQLLQESAEPAERVAGQLLLVRSRLGLHWTCTVLCAAAGEAMQRGDTEQAHAYLQRGLEECEGLCQGKLLRTLGQIELSVDPVAAVDYLRRALALHPDQADRVEIRLSIAHALHFLGDAEEAERVLLGGIAEAEESRDEREGPGLRRARERGADALRAERCLLRELELSGDAGTEADCAGVTEPLPLDVIATPGERHTRLSLAALRATRRGERREQAVRQARQALQEEHASLGRRIATRTVPVQVLARADELDLALEESEAILERAQAEGSRTLLTTAYGMRAEVRYRIGDIPGTLEDARSALRPGESAPAGHWSATGQAVAAAVAAFVEQDELRASNGLLSELGLDGELPQGASWAALLFHRGRLRAACGYPQAGLVDLLECGRRLSAAGQFNPSVLSWRSEAALLHDALGERDAAKALVGDELCRARRWGGRRALGRALRVSGLLTKGPAGERALRESVEVLEESSARLDLARSLTDLGIHARKSSRLGEARDHLRRAQSLAEQCGATVQARTARQELLVAGARPRRLTEVGVEALTPTERRVAHMAAAKFTNREIAGKLFVTQRTVELHLSRVYRKLSVPGRSGLTDHFAQLAEACGWDPGCHDGDMAAV
ncbi:AAA family ATPase [Streptomyces gamaensis]|uniref:AAA family ATPase n=1 Tax=Streptomyces gamaensis TaxID=1763542 RepID=A0ABW0Z434_9ACTN